MRHLPNLSTRDLMIAWLVALVLSIVLFVLDDSSLMGAFGLGAVIATATVIGLLLLKLASSQRS